MGATIGTKCLKVAAAGMVMAFSGAGAARADIIKVGDMVRGVQISQQQCAAIGQAVWVKVHRQGFCIRYYLSTDGGWQGKPIIILSGDKLGRLDSRSRNFLPSPDLQDIDTNALRKRASSLSRAARGPAIYLARVGIDGSSGHHSVRRTVLELHVTNAALEQLRMKYNFEGFHLVGQSGGSALTGGLLAMRNDIGCAVPGAGRLSRLRHQRETGDPSRDYFDPEDAIGLIAANRGARIIVVTDPRDHVVGVQHQVTFVNALRRHGRAVEQYFVQATDEKNHAVYAYASRAVALCAQNAPSTRISTELDLLVQKRTAEAQQGRQPQNIPSAMPPSAPYTAGAAASGYPQQTPYQYQAGQTPQYRQHIQLPPHHNWSSMPPRAQNNGPVYR